MNLSTQLGLNLTPEEEDKIIACYHDLGNDDLSDELYQKLYEHFCNNGEMPYGTAKARDGDPFEWITARIATAVEALKD